MESRSACADVEPQGADAENDSPAPANSPICSRRRDARSPPKRDPVSKCRSRGQSGGNREHRGRRRGPGRPGGHCYCWVVVRPRTRPERWARPETPRLSPAAAQQAAHSTKQSPSKGGSAENAAAQRSTTHLRPRVSHFSDGLTDSTTAAAVSAATAAVVALSAAAAAATTSLPAQHRFARQ